MLEYFLHQVADLQACNFVKKRLRQWCFRAAKFSRAPILKNVGERLILKWLYEVTVWYFIPGQSLSKPSWLSNITEMPVAFKSESSRQSGADAVFIFNLCFLLNLGFVCLSVTNTTHKVNACSHWTPPCLSFVFDFYKFIMQTSLQLRFLISEWLSWLKTRFSNLFLNSWQRMWHLKKLSKKSHIQNVVLVNFSLTTKKSYCSSLNI